MVKIISELKYKDKNINLKKILTSLNIISILRYEWLGDYLCQIISNYTIIYESFVCFDLM